jgi:polysaccharide export outer membrane protein
MDVKKLNRLILLPIIFGLLSCATSTSIGQFSSTYNIQEIDILKTDLGISPNQDFDDFSAIEESFENISFKKGDIIDVTIWEASPGFLFNASNKINSQSISGSASINKIPTQTVDLNGEIYIPYIGRINIENLSKSELERLIVDKLENKANNPQVLVNANYLNSEINIIGEVSKPGKYQLNVGDSILDLIAKAGGTKQNAKDTLLTLTRKENNYELPLSSIYDDPKNNIKLNFGDSLIFTTKPKKAVFLGALNSNQTLDFGPSDINLMEALSKVYGLNDQRANAKRIYIFRNLNENQILYSIDLTRIESFTYASRFYIKDNDIIIVTNNAIYEGQKALSIIGGIFSPVSGYLNAQNLQNVNE